MTDNRTPASRSALMSRIGGKDTVPELIARRVLHAMGYRYRLHRRDMSGTPDIVMPSRRSVVFVHGCFWHAHGCPKGRPPKSRLDFWLPKLERNRQRDMANQTQLACDGWTVLTIWQCETRNVESLAARLADFLGPVRQRRDRAIPTSRTGGRRRIEGEKRG